VGRVALCCPLSSSAARQLVHLPSATRISTASPAWSPRGDLIAFERADGHGRAAIYSIRADGTRLRRVWTPPAGDAHAPVWSPDGSLLAVAGLSGDRRQIWLFGRDGRNPRPLIDDPYEPRVAFRDLSFSPKGERVAFVGRSAGSSQLEVLTISDGSRTRLIAEAEVFNPPSGVGTLRASL
jgi:Tol biopolymer transport system component